MLHPACLRAATTTEARGQLAPFNLLPWGNFSTDSAIEAQTNEILLRSWAVRDLQTDAYVEMGLTTVSFPGIMSKRRCKADTMQGFNPSGPKQETAKAL